MNRQPYLLLSATLLACLAFGCGPKESDDPISPSADHESASKPPPLVRPDLIPPQLAEKVAAPKIAGVDPEDGQKDYVSFPAVGIKIVRPAGFADAEDFHGFLQADTQSSVMALKLPGPFSEVSGGFDAEELKKRGMILLKRDEIEIAGEKAVLLSLSQQAYGTEFSKWLVAFGNEEETTMVTATFPTSEEAALSAELRASVLSTKSDDSPPPAPGEDLNFTIEKSAKLGGMREIGKMLMFTKDDVLPAASPEDPLFGVAPSLSKIPIADHKQFAEQRLIQTAHTKISSITSSKSIITDELDGYELIAEAEDAGSGTPVVIYQVVLFEDDSSYILMQGLVGAELRDEYLPEFKAMASSFLRKGS